MNVIMIPEDSVVEKDEKYFDVLKGLCYAVDKFGIDLVITDLEEIQKEVWTYINLNLHSNNIKI